MIDLTLPLHLQTSSANLREHWATRHRRVKNERGLTAMRLRSQLITPVLRVTITRLAPRELDTDNIVGACKAVRDGIADYLRIDDRSPLVLWVYGQEKAKDHACRIRIERMVA